MRIKGIFKKTIHIFSILATAVLLVLLCMNVYIISAHRIFGVPYPAVFGYSYAVVISGSMSGSIEVNDMVIIHHEDSYTVNDVISFQSGNSLVTHRIADQKDNGFVTRGVQIILMTQEIVHTEEIVGKVVFVIPKIGVVMQFFTSYAGMACLFIAAVFLFVLPSFKNKKREKFTGGAGDEEKSECRICEEEN